MEYIEIERDEIPYSFEILLDVETYILEFMWNERQGIFTVSLYDIDENPLVYNEPIVYGQELFKDVRDLNFPIEKIIPLDPAGKETEVTYDNFGTTVLLVIDDETEGEDTDE